MQRVAQLGQRRQADVMERMPPCVIQRPRIASEKATAEEAHARAQRGDIRRRQQQNPSRLQNPACLPQERKMIFEMLDPFGGKYGMETLFRPGKRLIQVYLRKRRPQSF